MNQLTSNNEKLTPSQRLAKKQGLGDLISKVATPIAKALGLPCVDKETGKLKPESKCAKRRDSLNSLTKPTN